MFLTNAEDQMERAVPVDSRGESTPGPRPGVPSKRGPAAPPRPPREIVVYCEGFGAGPGCGWFVEVLFVELNHGGFSVFLRTDEDTFEDDTLDEDNDDPTRARRIATIEKPLTWRRVLLFLLRREYLMISDDSVRFKTRGLKRWQSDVIAGAMMRDGARGVDALTSFLSGLPDGDLQSLHDRFGGLRSRKASKVLPELADAVRGSGLRKKSLQKIAELVGVADPWDLSALTQAVEAYRRDP